MHQYDNDAIARRTRRIDTSAGVLSTNYFGYNARSEVTNALMSAITFAYLYDNIGNRESSATNGLALAYLANALNQYTNIASGVTNTLGYDLDGNLVSDGIWAYAWNAENRLIQASNGASVVSFAYDYMGRRFSKQVFDPADLGTPTSDIRFLYDGWNLISDLRSPTSGTSSTNWFVWGLDLSGSMQGAGGIGGLLATVSGGSAYFASYDANGNLTEYVSETPAVVARYDYDPFGGLKFSSGAKKDDFRFRFSTKYLDDATGLYYYGYRYYSPGVGRWLSRDPIEERGGGPNLYVFVRNSPLDLIDLLGLADNDDSPGDVVSEFLSMFSSETLWVWGPDAYYTTMIRNWSHTQPLIEHAKRHLRNNCRTWETTHMTTPAWNAGMTGGRRIEPDVDPNAFRAGWDDPGQDTSAAVAIRAYRLWLLTGIETDDLFYAAVGNHGLYVTVDEIDCVCKTATIKYWVYNSMTKGSLGGNPLYLALAGMAPQYMWWFWTEEYSWGQATGGPPAGGGGGGSGGWR